MVQCVESRGGSADMRKGRRGLMEVEGGWRLKGALACSLDMGQEINGTSNQH